MLDFWNEDEEGLFEEFSSKEDIINYYGNLDKKVIIDKYREEIKIAEKLNAEYAVFSGIKCKNKRLILSMNLHIQIKK